MSPAAPIAELSAPGESECVQVQRPFWTQDPVTVLEQQWEMDAFSAYGLALLVTEGKGPTEATPSDSFFFPFAFTSSQFLSHFQPLFADPAMLESLHHQSSARGLAVALSRYLRTIHCLQDMLVSLISPQAAENKVISAILATICYNLLRRDYHQAHIHLQGLKSMITAKGGVQKLDASHELRLMIFWIDVTFMLLFNTVPLYPIPPNLIYADPLPELWVFMPAPLSKVLATAEPFDDAPLTHVACCLASLNQVAISIESELAIRGGELWKDEMFLGLRLNPVAHRLFDPIIHTTGPTTHSNQTVQLLRLGGILLVVWIKRISRSYPGSPVSYLSDLLGLISAHDSGGDQAILESSDDFLPIRLWLISLCAISCSYGSPEWRLARSLMTKALRARMMERQAAMDSVRQMPWISAFEKPMTEFWSRLHGDSLELLE